jgi:hypothetical protein
MSSNLASVLCPVCRSVLNESYFNTGGETFCTTCGSPMEVYAFPALYRSFEGKTAEPLLMEEEASCFYHSQKKAVRPCSHCGRFLCSLCDVELDGEHLCPKCIEAGKEKKKLRSLESRCVLYDDIALSLSILPMLIFYFTIVTAPVVVFLTIRYWNAPSSILPRTKIRFLIASTFALLQIAGWVAVVFFIWSAWNRN